MEVAIIGGGASGLACAISLMKKSNSISVTVYEKMPRVLKKILVTGNGRCNLTNMSAANQFYRGETEFIDEAFYRYPPESTVKFFRSIGLLTKVEDENRVYPMSSQAASVVTALLNEADRLGVKLVTDTEVVSLSKKQDVFIINNTFKADCVVIAAGGSAAKAQGTDGASFRLLQTLGVNVKEPKPALVSLNAADFTKSLKGVRNVSFIRLFIDGKDAYSEKGEVQYTDYGISGIPVMQLSGLVSTSDSKNITVVIDSLPGIEESEIFDYMMKRREKNPNETAESMMNGILPKALGNYLMLLCSIKKDSHTGDITENKMNLLANITKFWEVPIDSARGFEYAQVTAGGVGADELDVTTLESKKIKGLYCTGEAVNIYGLCGGFNLQWAWSSGRLCADSIIKENSIVKDK